MSLRGAKRRGNLLIIRLSNFKRPLSLTLSLGEGTKELRHAELDSASQVAPSSDTSCHLLPPMGRRQFSFAFTLAEVLITLGVIGVVAALTMPTLVQKYQERVWTTGFLRVYSILENAYKMAQNEYGIFENWGDDFAVTNTGHRNRTNGQIIFDNVIKPYVKVTDIWLTGRNGCMPHNYSMLDGTKKGVGQPENWMYMTPAVALPTGECIILGSDADFYVDINGKKGPNVLGKDTFLFSFNGTNPVRLKPGSMELGWTDTANYCDRTDNHGWNAGTSCGFWVARHHNMDYLHLPFDEIKKQWRGNGKQW